MLQLLSRLANGMLGWPHPLKFQLDEGLIHLCAISSQGLNGTGPDNYEEGLFKEQFVSVVTVMNHNTSQPLFLYYATRAPHKATRTGSVLLTTIYIRSSYLVWIFL